MQFSAVVECSVVEHCDPLKTIHWSLRVNSHNDIVLKPETKICLSLLASMISIETLSSSSMAEAILRL